MITTTLNRIQNNYFHPEGWRNLLAGLGKRKGDDESLPFAKIVEINGLRDALWCCRVEPQYGSEWRLFAIWCARQVQHLMECPRIIDALDVAERYAKGRATSEELNKAEEVAAKSVVEALDAWTVECSGLEARAEWAQIAEARVAAASATIFWAPRAPMLSAAAAEAALTSSADWATRWETIIKLALLVVGRSVEELQTKWQAIRRQKVAVTKAQTQQFLKIVTNTAVRPPKEVI